ncbi:glycosyltransferase family 4 protein [Sphingomonas sp.]|uniref:glycosyltransferase family 4 protein n=1 Tax=Sphingomonas sp. TaxID=28214 RepID=UPI0025F007D0|nr:glycosyltransferase family 4 protein [Sphingomonas sp.]
MRILHLSSLYPPYVLGGAERVVEMLAEGQAREGHEVGVAYLSPGPDPAGDRNGVKTFPIANPNLFWIEDIPSKPAPLRVANKALTIVNPRSTAAFGRIVEEWRPDVVHSHSMVIFSPMAWARAKSAGARLVHTLHDYDMVCLKATLFKGGHNCGKAHAACDYSSRWKARYAPLFDAVVGVSQAVLAEHVERGALKGVSPDRRSVIWNGVALEKASFSERRERNGPLTFGFMGRLMPEKGLDTLLAACRLLPAEGWRLRIAGKARGDVDYQALAAGLPVEFCGFVEPGAFLDSLDVLAVPPVWREPFGLTVVEALARGVPVLGSDNGAVGELVEKSGLGRDWVVPAGNPAALAARMRGLIDGRRAALPFPASYGDLLDAVAPGKMVRSYLSLYEHVLSERMAAE